MSNINKFVNFLFFIICLIFIIFILLGEVDAQVSTSIIGSNSGGPYTNNDLAIHLPSKTLSNLGEGYVNFIVSIEGKFKVYTIAVNTSDNNYVCQIGSSQGYSDSTTQIYTYTAVCPIHYTGSRGITSIQISGYSWSSPWYYATSNYITWSNFNNNTDYTSVLNTLNSNINSLNTKSDNINSSLQSINNTCINNFNKIISKLENNNSTLINSINNQTQQQHQDSQNINNSIQDTNNTLKDSSIDSNNTTSSTNDWNSKNASNGTITNLLTLPIQLMQGYVNGMNSSCTPFNLGSLFGTTIILPCINVGNLIGSSLWSVIDVLFSGFMIFGIAKKLIKIFNDFTNMKSNQVDELYGGGA